MIEEALNNWLLRIILGIVVGVPLTLLAIVLGFHGLILGYAGIAEWNFSLLTLGVLTVIGLAGIGGAWVRLLAPSDELTECGRRVVRSLLWCGVASSLGLAFWALIVEDGQILSVLLIMLALAGVTFVYATPKVI